MTTVRVAAVQATYELMNRDATIDRMADLTADAAARGAQLVVFPEVFVPGTPIWIWTQPIWDGDDEWFQLLLGNSVIVGPGGGIIAGPIRQREETLIADLDMGDVRPARRFLDPVGHYNRPDVFRLHVDTSPHEAVVTERFAPSEGER
jgi:nitrilase